MMMGVERQLAPLERVASELAEIQEFAPVVEVRDIGVARNRLVLGVRGGQPRRGSLPGVGARARGQTTRRHRG